MKRGLAAAALLGGALLWPVPDALRAQSNPVKDTGEFSTVEYFDPPNELQISSRLSGAEAIPVSQDVTIIKHMKLETFETNGTAKYVIVAPECLYDQNKGVANSAGPLEVRPAGHQWELDGVGFLWRQDDSFLIISNQVQTDIKNGSNLKAAR
jgi:hypothetical protein